jgi:hypothetical protein
MTESRHAVGEDAVRHGGGALLARRQRLVAGSLAALTAGVVSMVAMRLHQPLTDVHVSPPARDTDPADVRKTPNPYRGRAGTVQLDDGRGVALGEDDTVNDRWRTKPTDLWLADVTGARDLTLQLRPALADRINRGFETDVAGQAPKAPDVLLTLRPELQGRLQRWSGCFTGVVAACQDLPATLRDADPRFTRLTESGPRSPIIGYLVAHEDSGQILAMGGRYSACAVTNLRRRASVRADGRHPIFNARQPACAQFPDARHADWLGLSGRDAMSLQPGQVLSTTAEPAINPSQLMVPGGSTEKVKLAVACTMAGQLGGLAETARQKFALSADNDYFKGMALRCVTAYREVYRSLAQPRSLLQPADAWRRVGVNWSARSMPPVLPPGRTLPPSLYLQIDGRVAREQGRVLLPAGVSFAELDTSRNLATLAIGNGGNEATLAHRAHLMRLLGLAARGVVQALPLHLASTTRQPLLPEPIQLGLTAHQAQEVLHLLDGVTADFGSAAGTARLACLRVLGADCPKSGVPGLSGKTGTSDVEDADEPQLVRKGFSDPMPFKHFMGRFQVKGDWYVVATLAARGRKPGLPGLDDTNAAAELALLAVRELAQGAR